MIFKAFHTNANAATWHPRPALTPDYVVANFTLVGVIEAHDIEHAHYRANGMDVEDGVAFNHVFGQDNTQARIRRAQSHTSTSVGDVYSDLYTGEFFLCASFGWESIGFAAGPQGRDDWGRFYSAAWEVPNREVA